MSTPANATVWAVRGQVYNLSGVIKSLATGNPITGGLTTLAAVVSKDDGNFASITSAPTEIQTSGFFTLDLSAAEMTAQKILVNVTVANSSAIYWSVQINTVNLGQFTGRADAQPILRLEQYLIDDLVLNGWNAVTTNGAQMIYDNADGSTHFQSSVTQGQVSGQRTKTV